MQKILIIGSNSKIAVECCKIWAKKKYELFLISRDIKKMKENSKIFYKLGATKVRFKKIKFDKNENYIKNIENNFIRIKNLNLVLISFGELLNEKQINRWYQIEKNIYLNGLETCRLIYLINKIFKKKNNPGTIAVITSVAGEIIKKSNFIYGLGKSLVSNFITGINFQNKDSNIRIIDIKPGYIITPMTSRFKKNFLWTKSISAAKIIVNQLDKKNEVIYVPNFWKYIMAFLKLLPKKINKHL